MGAPKPTGGAGYMTKEQQKQMMAKYREYEEQLYEGHPDVKRFVKRKKRWIGFLILSGLVLSVTASVFVAGLSGGNGVAMVRAIVSGIAGFGIALILLLGSMKANWRFSLLLYLIGFSRLFSWYEGMVNSFGISSPGEIPEIYISAFWQSSLVYLALHDILSVVYALLIILTAVVLTIPSRSRALAAEAEVMEEKLSDYMRENSKG